MGWENIMKNKLVEVELALPNSLIRRMAKVCAESGITMDELIEEALKRFIKKYKEEENVKRKNIQN
jgi:metal-responsive CopG/Arc/MetJ family transcriptional regulator